MSMSAQDITAFLNRVDPALLGVVGTIDAAGFPSTIPVWYRYDGEVVNVWTTTERAWPKHLKRNPKTSFAVGQEQKAHQQLNGFVLRHGHHWERGKTRWTQAHYRWLEGLAFSHPWQREVLVEYHEAVRAAAVVILAELGDLRRFDNPGQLMGYLGLVPSEDSSGPRRRQGAVTCAGNTHARRILVQSAWCYRLPARQTAHLKRKAKNASGEARAIGWRAQRRLCGRYRHLIEAGKNQKVVCVAIARELVGFIWDLVCVEMDKRRAV